LLLGCFVLASCDQFARVGAPSELPDAVAPHRDGGDGGLGSEGDATVEDSGRDAGERDGGEGCASVVIAICDPIKNEGCSGALGTQCAIDYVAMLKGYCIFASPPAPGMLTECFNSGITESCPATFTCFADRCEKICLCDSDCEPGRCCSRSVAATGFSVCGDC
jgi:hypothetical protein